MGRETDCGLERWMVMPSKNETTPAGSSLVCQCRKGVTGIKEPLPASYLIKVSIGLVRAVRQKAGTRVPYQLGRCSQRIGTLPSVGSPECTCSIPEELVNGGVY